MISLYKIAPGPVIPSLGCSINGVIVTIYYMLSRHEIMSNTVEPLIFEALIKFHEPYIFWPLLQLATLSWPALLIILTLLGVSWIEGSFPFMGPQDGKD